MAGGNFPSVQAHEKRTMKTISLILAGIAVVLSIGVIVSSLKKIRRGE